MADSINPRCPVHGVRHKRPMCDPDETVVLDRPYEVGDQQDTDLDADIAASRRARTDHRLPPHTGGYRPQPPSRDLTERPTPPAGPGGGSPSPDVLAGLRRDNEAAKRNGWKADIGVDDVDLLLDLAERDCPPVMSSDDGGAV